MSIMSSDIVPSSSISSNTPNTLLLSNFWSVILKDYPDSGKLTASGKKPTKGVARYVCKVCKNPPWSNIVKGNARSHCLSRHADISVSAPTASISTFFTSVASNDTLWNIFNVEAYKEAIVGLLTVRRVPFSGVEWPELHKLALACNPAIED